MKLKAYAALIQAMALKHPNATVICAGDHEGNSFEEVVFTPTPGSFVDGEFDDEGKKVNAVCIN